jgi:hypothetical protein
MRLVSYIDAYTCIFNQVVKVESTEDHLLAASVTPTPCTVSLSDGAVSYITYNTTTKQIQYISTVPKNSYLSFGYGTSMSKTDMVVWEANGASSTQIDVYSTSHNTPSTVTNTYTTTFTFDTVST